MLSRQDHGEPWRAALIEHLRGNRDLLYHTIRAHPTLRDRLRLYGPAQVTQNGIHQGA